MGDYTRFEFRASLGGKTPQAVINVLEHMLTWRADQLAAVPDHPFFGKPRWSCVGAAHGAKISALSAGGHQVEFDCRFKNYDGEIEAFLNWIFPHLVKEPGKIVGQVRNDDEQTFEMPGALLVIQECGINMLMDPSNNDLEDRQSGSAWPSMG